MTLSLAFMNMTRLPMNEATKNAPKRTTQKVAALNRSGCAALRSPAAMASRELSCGGHALLATMTVSFSLALFERRELDSSTPKRTDNQLCVCGNDGGSDGCFDWLGVLSA